MAKDATKKEIAVGDRIAEALNASTLTSRSAAALRAEAEAKAQELRQAAAWWRDQALDPRATGTEVAERRRQADDAQFEADRIGRAVETLGALEAELAETEAREARQAAYDAASAERDAVAEVIRRDYPALAQALVGLIDAIAASNRAVLAVNRALPDGAAPLELAESLARDLQQLKAEAPLPDGVDYVPGPRRRVRPDVTPPMIVQMMVASPTAELHALRPVRWFNRDPDGAGPRLPVPDHSRNW